MSQVDTVVAVVAGSAGYKMRQLGSEPTNPIKQHAAARRNTRPRPEFTSAKFCSPPCNQVFTKDTDLLKHIHQDHTIAGIPTISGSRIRGLGLQFCNECLRISLIGRKHPTPCRAPSSKRQRKLKESMSTFVEKQHGSRDVGSIDVLGKLDWNSVFSGQLPSWGFTPRSLIHVDALNLLTTVVFYLALETDASSNTYEHAWKLVFVLPALLFHIPGVKGKWSVTRTIDDRLVKALNGEWDRLVADMLATLDIRQSQPRDLLSANSVAGNLRRIKQLAKAGELSKASNLLSSHANIMSATDVHVRNTLDKLFAPHTTPDNVTETIDDNDHHVIEPDDVFDALSRMKRSSAGPSGWHLPLIKSLAKQRQGLVVVADLLSRIINGKVPAQLLLGLRTGRLIPLSKPNNGIRPIVCQETLLRLLSRVVVRQEQHHLAHGLAPVQTGVGIPGGVEFTVHSARALLELNPQWSMISIDCTNAYGSLRRSAILAALPSSDQGFMVSQYFKLFVSPTTHMVTTEGVRFATNDGVPQGDPLSPLLFALGIHPILKKLSDSGHCKVFAYLDDVNILGDQSQILQLYDCFVAEAAKVGLSVNPRKTQVHAREPSTDFSLGLSARGLPAPQLAVSVLGSPVGTPAAETELLTSSFDPTPYEKLQSLEGSQIKLLLTRYWLGAVRSHTARACPPQQSEALLQLHDKHVMSVVCSVLGTRPDDISLELRREIELPLSRGGLGIRELSKHRRFDYLASVLGVVNTWKNYDEPSFLQQWLQTMADDSGSIHRVLRDVQELWKTAEQSTYIDRSVLPIMPVALQGAHLLPSKLWSNQLPEKLQQMFSKLVVLLTEAHIIQHQLSSSDDLAQFNSKRGRGASAALAAVPTSYALTINDQLFTIVCRLWLRLPLLPLLGLQSVSTCACGELLTEAHLLNCNNDGAFNKRHTAIVSELVAMCTSTKLQCRTEPLADEHSDRQDRHDLEVLRCTQGGDDVRIDVTVRNPLARSIVDRCAREPMHAAQAGYAAKMEQYGGLLQPGQQFLPFVLEAYGAMHQDVFTLINMVAKRAAGEAPDGSCWAAPTFVAYWLQRISVALWRENAKAAMEIAAAINQQSASEIADN